jgi:TolB-like protein/Flp pilus assembly protein TadD
MLGESVQDYVRVRMSGESSTPAGAVFLSYASQDAEAAKRICEALRAAGIEVWFDQSELRGGDAWDQSIRKQIKTCALFLPLISHTTHDRREGYFRLEWKLAIDRSHLMDAGMAFLLPIVIDDTRDDDERVPERFREVQWTRLPGGVTPGAFVERVQRLLSGESSTATRAGAASGTVPTIGGRASASGLSRRVLQVAVAVVILGTIAWFAIEKPWVSKPATSAAFAPPPHSVAVLPFVNMSGDKEQEYFSDGLTEELLNSLAAVNELQVAARTSAFSFKGQNTDIGLIARKLNVGAILEGSVRRSGHTIRVSTELINSVTGFQLWSKSYDRDAGDVLKLQTEIATAVAGALKVTLLGDVAQKIELGGTRNPAAFDAYLRASKALQSRHDDKDMPPAIAAYTEAIRLDPNYALAFAGRSYALLVYIEDTATGRVLREGLEKAESDARRALALAPELAEAHIALAVVFSDGTLDFARAGEEYERAVALAPGHAMVLRKSGEFAAYMGRFDAGIAALRRAVVLDPIDYRSRALLGNALYAARRYGESAAAYTEAISLNPDYATAVNFRGLALYELGDLQRARASCESKREDWLAQQCLAVVYEKLGRHADAEAELKKIQAAFGDGTAYQYATIYAQWGNRTKALEWFDKAMRLRDPGLVYLKTDPLMDPLRHEPRFQAALKELKFPD